MRVREALLAGPLGFGTAPLGNMFRNISEEQANRIDHRITVLITRAGGKDDHVISSDVLSQLLDLEASPRHAATRRFQIPDWSSIAATRQSRLLCLGLTRQAISAEEFAVSPTLRYS